MFLYNLCKRKEEKHSHFSYFHTEEDDNTPTVKGKQRDTPDETEKEKKIQPAQQDSND